MTAAAQSDIHVAVMVELVCRIALILVLVYDMSVAIILYVGFQQIVADAMIETLVLPIAVMQIEHAVL